MAHPTTPVPGIRAGETFEQVRKRSLRARRATPRGGPGAVRLGARDPNSPIFTSTATPAKRSGPTFAIGELCARRYGQARDHRGSAGRPPPRGVLHQRRGQLPQVGDQRHGPVEDRRRRRGLPRASRAESARRGTARTTSWRTPTAPSPTRGPTSRNPGAAADDNPTPSAKRAGAFAPSLAGSPPPPCCCRHAPPLRAARRPPRDRRHGHRASTRSFCVNVVLADGQKKFFHLPWCKVLK